MGERSAAASTTDTISGWVKAAKDIIVPYKKKKKKKRTECSKHFEENAP